MKIPFINSKQETLEPSEQTMSAEQTIDATTVVAEETVEETLELTQLEQAKRAVRKYTLIGTGIGVIPFPLVDLTAVLATQLKMISDLSAIYDVTFYRHKVKNVIGSLLGSFGAGFAIVPVLASSLKFIPGVGSTAGAVALPVTTGAATYALGQVFIMHFEAGGTLLDFNPDAMREHFKAEFAKGKEVASEAAAE